MEPPSIAMERGTAFHQILEDVSTGKMVRGKSVYSHNGFDFDFAPLDTSGHVTLLKPDAVEVPATREFELASLRVTLGRAAGRYPRHRGR